MHFKKRALTSLHHSDSGVNLGGERQHDLVGLAVDADAHAFFDVGGGDLYIMDHETCNTGFKHSVVKTAKAIRRTRWSLVCNCTVQRA